MKKILLLFLSSFLFISTTLLVAQCTGEISLETQTAVDSFSINYGCSMIEGNLVIGFSSDSGSSDIYNLAGLSNLVSIEGDLIIQRTHLTNLDGLQNLTDIGEGLQIQENIHLTNINGLQNINSSLNSLWIDNNIHLGNLNGLQNITSAGSYLWILNNYDLTNIDGLQNISSTSELKILNNNSLTNIDGLQSLTNIGGDLSIQSNSNLTNLNGLQNISNIGGELRIYYNSSLEACCSIIPIVVEDTYIFNNHPNCNSIEAILEFCEQANIQAICFFDENQNGILDFNEQSIQQPFNLEPSALYSFADQSGIVYFYLDSFGEYELSFNNNNPLWEYTGANNPTQINFSNIDFNDTLHYFPMIPIANFTIQSIDLSSSITRCNQETNYWLSYINKGTTINNGTIELKPSPLGELVSANPPADSTAEGKLYWFYEDLYPNHSKQIHLLFEMPSVQEIGSQINFEANIETNEGDGGNKALLSSELVCAYDPNDKLHSPSGYAEENYTLFGDTLEYTIRFQNTGNDTAFTVVIEDELSEYLDLNTFRPIASSHNMESLVNLNNRLATFTFNDIYLADSFVNEPASHGFVKYQIMGNEELAENTDVKNTASIFFDQNPAIITNTTNNRMVSILPSLPLLASSPTELDFGEIALDESAYLPQLLTIENPGELSLHIQEFSFGNTVFNSGELQIISVEGQSSVQVPIYFEPTEAGTYQSELILKSNGGELSIELSGIATLETGLNPISQPSCTVFPNPNEGLFYLTSNEPIKTYQVRNSLGTIILNQNTSNTNLVKIDLRQEEKGLYFISVQTDKGDFVEKLIVQ